MTVLTIATLFPLDTVAAGDQANGPALVRRARQRGIEATSVVVSRPEDMASADIYLLGGEGLAGVGDLVTHLVATPLADQVRDGRATVFAVDAGLAALGRTWTDAAGTTHEGLGLVGTAVRARPGTVRTVVSRPAPALGLPAMLGWHADAFEVAHDPGVDHLVALATADGAAAIDGVLAPGVIATLLHGPALALNPELADLVLARALRAPDWDALPIPAVEDARARRMLELRRQAGAQRRRGFRAGRH
jgi:hypothetical protein